MNVLVFGGCGNIGSYIASDLCERGLGVTIFDQNQPSGFCGHSKGVSIGSRVTSAIRSKSAQQ
jgi:nucleoside-diphosphate-sugar epimerase